MHRSSTTTRSGHQPPAEDPTDLSDDIDVHPSLQEDASLDSKSNPSTMSGLTWSFSPDPYTTLISQQQQSTLQYPTKEYLHDCFHPSVTDDLTSHKASSFY
jgi:hypothetical protein